MTAERRRRRGLVRTGLGLVFSLGVVLSGASAGPGERAGRLGDKAKLPPASAERSVEGDVENGWAAIAQGSNPRLLQLSLIWTGYYQGFASGRLDAPTKAAIQAFQSAAKAPPTGQLTTDQLVDLLKAAAAARVAVGWTTYESEQVGYRIGYPAGLLDKVEAGQGGGRVFSSADRRSALEIEVLDPMTPGEFQVFFAQLRDHPDAGKTMTTAAQAGDTISFAGRDQTSRQRFAGRIERRPNGLVGFTFFYAEDTAGRLAPIADAMVNEFTVPERLGAPAPAQAGAVVGIYAKDEARYSMTTEPPASPWGRPAQAPPPPAVPDPRDLVALPALPMAVADQALPPVGVFRKVKDAVWVVLAAKLGADGKPDLEGDVSQGSAVAITAQHLLTNCHVVGEFPFVGIFRKDDLSDLIPVTVRLKDVAGDRCILRTAAAMLPATVAIRGYGDVEVGERSYTIGAPSGLDLTLGEGLVSGKRKKDGIDMVQTSAPISPGSSGGGLFDERGNLIGITTFKLRDAENLNFAIAADSYLAPGLLAGR